MGLSRAVEQLAAASSGGPRPGPRALAAAVFTVAVLVLAPAAGDSKAWGQSAGAKASTVSGVVLDEASGQAIQNAVVSLTAARQAGAPEDAVTDAQGRFVFRGLSPSVAYSLAASRPGYYVSAGSAARDDFGTSRPTFTVSEGERLNDVEILMARWGEIHGCVRDEEGEPVVGVPVRAIARVLIAGLPHLAAGPIATTDDRGAFTIGRLRRGKYLVVVPSVQSVVPVSVGDAGRNESRAGLDVGNQRLILSTYPTPPISKGRPRVYPPTFYPAASSVKDALEVDLSDRAESVAVDITVTPQVAVRASGRVIGPTPESGQGLVLRLLSAGTEDLGMGSEVATAVVVGGRFTFVGVPAGTYTLVAARTTTEFVRGAATAVGLPATPGWPKGPATGRLVQSASPATEVAIRSSIEPDDVHASLPVVVGDEDVTGLEVVLRQGATLRGRFEYERPPDIPERLVSVSADPANGSALLAVNGPRAGTGGPGDAFEVSGLRSGEYWLRVRGSGRWGVKSIAAQGVEYLDRPFDMAGGDVNDVVVTLTDKLTRVSGNVRDEKGNRVRLATVVAFPTDSALWSAVGFEPLRMKAADCVGGREYLLGGLPKGRYYFAAVDRLPADAWQNEGFFNAVKGKATVVSLDWGDDKVQDLVVTTVAVR